MIVWVTKYALTQGIFEQEVTKCFDTNPDMVRYENSYGGITYLLHNEWWSSRELAYKYAEGMRQRKIASLKRQLQKLEALKF